jgi:hypothetical protein
VISIRKYLYEGAANGSPRPAEAQSSALAAKVLGGLITSVADHVLSGEALTDLQREARSLAKRLEIDPSPAVVTAAVAEADDILLRSQTQLEASCRVETAELQKMIAMLSQTLQALSAGSSSSVRRLQRIEQDLESTSAAGDIAAIRGRLAVCLDYVRKEAEKEKAEAERIGVLEQRFRDAQEQMAILRSGVQGRRDAEEFLHAHHEVGVYLGIFCLEHFAGIHQRYGPAAAEEVASAFIQRRLVTIPSFERVFRWDASTLLVAVVSPAATDAVRAEVRGVVSEPLERHVQVGGRLAVLRVAHRWTLIPAWESDAAQLRFEIDRFTSDC